MFITRAPLGPAKFTSNLAQAVWLAAEAGIVTKRELQARIVKSPKFSPDTAPFVISDPWKPYRPYKPQEFSETVQQRVDEDSNTGGLVPLVNCVQDPEIGPVDEALAAVEPGQGAGTKGINQLFWHHGAWWRSTAEGSGTCKRSTSTVKLVRGSGNVVVNRNEDLYWRWHRFYNRMDVVEPLYLANAAGAYDVYIRTQGGGTTGQSKATRLALARALVHANPACQPSVAAALVEDLRQKLPKMPGRTGARSQRHWRKR